VAAFSSQVSWCRIWSASGLASLISWPKRGLPRRICARAGLITAILSEATFVVVLWTVGGALTLHVDDVVIKIPGFLVIRRFIETSEKKNQADAQ
jgi:hypothetical protein